MKNEKNTGAEVLQTLASGALSVARKIIVDDQRDLQPVFLLIQQGGELVPVAVEFQNDEQKDEAAQAVSLLMRAQRTAAYVFVCEAWVLIADAKDGLPKYKPSQSESRKEMLFINGETYDGNEIAVMVELGRDMEGKRTMGEPEYMSTDARNCGRFANLLTQGGFDG